MQTPVWTTSFVLLIVLTLPFLITMLFLARRKGKSLVVYLLLGLIPGANTIAALWLASQTDASVKAELEDLRRRLDAKV
jgi:cell division protein FtsB